MTNIISFFLTFSFIFSFFSYSTFNFKKAIDIDGAAPSAVTGPIISGTSDPERGEDNFSEIFSSAAGEYSFSSGAGAWGTILNLNADGTFSGNYGDSNMGEIGEGYPNGTHYQCDFTGSFQIVEKLSDYSYEIVANELKLEKEPETEEIIDGIRYIYSEAYGLSNETMILYTPQTPVSELSEECIMWYGMRSELEERQTLDTYCIYSPKEETAFYLYP